MTIGLYLLNITVYFRISLCSCRPPKSHVKAYGLPGFIAQAKFAYGAMNPGRVCKWARRKAPAAADIQFRGDCPTYSFAAIVRHNKEDRNG